MSGLNARSSALGFIASMKKLPKLPSRISALMPLFNKNNLSSRETNEVVDPLKIAILHSEIIDLSLRFASNCKRLAMNTPRSLTVHSNGIISVCVGDISFTFGREFV